MPDAPINVTFDQSPDAEVSVAFDPAMRVEVNVDFDSDPLPPRYSELLAALDSPAQAGYDHQQLTAQSVWRITHGLGYEPVIQTWDSAGSRVFGSESHESDTAAIVTFSVPFAGRARLI